MSLCPSLGRVADPEVASTVREKLPRVYEVWKGSNVFLLGGRIIFGSDARSLILTIFLVVTPVLIFCVFVARRLLDDSHHLGICIMAVAVVLTSMDVAFLLVTSGRDPGIVPRNVRPPDPESYEGSFNVGDGRTPQLRIPRTKEVSVNGVSVKVKYCDTCMLYRPPRCSHCSICNNCVERFDHHCPWVGQCIGQRNYRFFFMFIFSTTLLCMYVFAFSWVRIIRIMDTEHSTIWKAMIKTPASITLIVYTFVSFWFVSGLSVFHLYLIITNQTTYENFRYRYDRQTNPYNRGLIENVKEVFFSRIPPSKTKFRARVTQEQLLQSSSMSATFISSSMSKSAVGREADRKLFSWSEGDASGGDPEAGSGDNNGGEKGLSSELWLSFTLMSTRDGSSWRRSGSIETLSDTVVSASGIERVSWDHLGGAAAATGRAGSNSSVRMSCSSSKQ